VRAGHGKPGAGRGGPLPRAGAIKDCVNRTVHRLTSLSSAEDRMQLVGDRDQLGRLPRLASGVAVRRRKLWIWLILLAGGCPRGIGELVDELHHPGQLDLRNREHAYQCNAIKAIMTLQADRWPPWPVRAARLPGNPVWHRGRTRDHEWVELRRSDGSVISVAVVGEPNAVPVLFCHGLADSRLSAYWFEPAARELGLRLVAPDRPGIGGSDPRRLRRLADWVADATLVLNALQVDSAALFGVSAGGPFAAACAAALPGRVRSLLLVSPLGRPEWPTHGMAPGERLSLALAGQVPAFGGWFLGRLAVLARHSPRLFFGLTAASMPDVDSRELEQPSARESFLINYAEAFRRGSGGVAQDLRVLTQPWGFDLGCIGVPTLIRHGDADTTVPLQHARLYAEAIPGAQLQIHPGHGHFSILAAGRELLAPLAG
jgi:pimeloyl-ACP methyl ester carboxylesterase